MNLLVGDIGGTHTRLAIGTASGFVAVHVYDNDDHPEPLTLFQAFISSLPEELRPRQARFAVAAPVVSDDVHLTNRDWHLNGQQLREALGLQSVKLINDFAAIVLGVPGLQAGGYHKIGGGSVTAHAAVLALGPGTGFGMAAAVPSSGHWTVVSSEGGHATLSILGHRELDIVEHLHGRGHPTAIEEVLSGPGLLNLYQAIAGLDGSPQAANTQEQVTQLARNGDKLGLEALDLFFRFLGRTTGDMALAFNAAGGVYLAGGILPKLLSELERSRFREEFENKGSFSSYVSGMPTFLVTDPLVAFRGLASMT